MRVVIAVAGLTFGAVLVLAVVDQADQVVLARDDLGVVDVRAVRAELLVDRHDCWTGEAPADMGGRFPVVWWRRGLAIRWSCSGAGGSVGRWTKSSRVCHTA